jgi:hypothetical protein
MNTERWNKLFDNRSLYRLLYALQIIDDIMQRREQAVDQSASGRQRWCESFVARGGLQHLIRIIDASATAPSSSSATASASTAGLLVYNSALHGPRAIYHMTLSLLFKIINNFLCIDQSFAGFSGDVSDIKAIKCCTFIKNFEGTINDVIMRCAVPLLASLDTNCDGATEVIISVTRFMVGYCRTFPSLVISLTGAYILTCFPFRIHHTPIAVFIEYKQLDALLVTLLLRNPTSESRTHAARAV